MTRILSNELEQELEETLSLTRLSFTGLFIKAINENDSVLITKELLLHRAVLDRALIDYFSDNAEIRNDVIEWLDLSNIDFTDACERAFFDPEDVLEIFHSVKRILKGNNAKFKKAFRKKDLSRP